MCSCDLSFLSPCISKCQVLVGLEFCSSSLLLSWEVTSPGLAPPQPPQVVSLVCTWACWAPRVWLGRDSGSLRGEPGWLPGCQDGPVAPLPWAPCTPLAFSHPHRQAILLSPHSPSPWTLGFCFPSHQEFPGDPMATPLVPFPREGCWVQSCTLLASCLLPLPPGSSASP